MLKKSHTDSGTGYRPRRLRLSPALVVSIIALIVALGGTGYAAIKLPANSVGAKQLKKNAVVSKKVKDGSLLAKDFKAGQLPAGPKGDKGDRGDTGPKGDTGPAGLASKSTRIAGPLTT